MSVWRRSGRVVTPSGVYYALTQELQKLSLAPVKRVSFTFDPFHQNAAVVRDVMYYLSFPRIRETNYKTVFKNNVVCDMSEPSIECKLENGKTLIFKTGYLTTLEIVQQFNKYILPLVPPPQDLSASVPKTKSQKKK